MQIMRRVSAILTMRSVHFNTVEASLDRALCCASVVMHHTFYFLWMTNTDRAQSEDHFISLYHLPLPFLKRVIRKAFFRTVT